jgi:signal transduction histidine kinase
VRDTGSPPDSAVAAPLLRTDAVRAQGGGGQLGPGLLGLPLGSGWQSAPGWLDLAWVVLWILGLAGIVVFERWEYIPFHLLWISFALLYSFRIRQTRSTLWVLAAVIVTTSAAIGFDVHRGAQPADELTEVPLMAAMFWVMMWHSQRRLAASAERAAVGEENERLLATQRRFLQDASHQLRTPITIALGHSELLARSLADSQDRRDIKVIVGELNRLRALSERLLLIAASENPDFLQPEPVALDQLTMDVIRRWRPAAERRWQLGQLDHAIVHADRDRLRIAVDALLENATQHTGPGDTIRLSVTAAGDTQFARLSVQDSGSGIAAAELASIFERFAAGSDAAGRRGTGLGLPLVRAVARGHGGEVRVHSSLGAGSTFELLLPVFARQGSQLALPPTPAAGSGRRGLLRNHAAKGSPATLAGDPCLPAGGR